MSKERDNSIFSSLYGDSFLETEKRKEIQRRLASSRLVKLTPDVKKEVEKIGQNTYRTKTGSVEWSIILVDGQPHLARREVDEEGREEKIANPDAPIK